MTNNKELAVPSQSVDLANPAGLIKFASELKKFIIQQQLFTQIKGKNYVEVEGWQFAGAATGVVPVVKEVFNIQTPSMVKVRGKDGKETEVPEIKYRAEVELRRIEGGQVIGYGVAICSNAEEKKRGFEEYAVASMAQTRATGKAYRNTFAWLMKIAGYEPTPAEEAADIKTQPGDSLNEEQKQEIKSEAERIAADLQKQAEAGQEDQSQK